VAIGHRVTLLSAGTVPGHLDRGGFQWLSYQDKGTTGHFWNSDFIRRCDAALRSEIDLVMAAFPYQSFMLSRLATRHGVPIIYDAHNVERERFRAMGNRIKALVVGLSEAFLIKRARAVLAVTSEDAQTFSERYKGVNVHLLPNGVDLQHFHYGQSDRALLERYGLVGGRVVLFFGALDYSPNTQALDRLLNVIWPKVARARPDAMLLVVGRQPPDWARDSDRVRITGMVEDIARHIQLADLVVVPLSSGGGSRLKIIEALACARTVLSTRLGAQGVPRGDGQGLIIGELDDFSKAIVDLLDRHSGEPNDSARQIAENFGWRSLVQQIDWDALA
jgi:glycosyltransferase involved in cell wall biosynthesis